MPFGKKVHSKLQSRAIQARCHGAQLSGFGGLSQRKACEMVKGYSAKKYRRLPERVKK